MTVGELRERMSSAELTMWAGYWRIRNWENEQASQQQSKFRPDPPPRMLGEA